MTPKTKTPRESIQPSCFHNVLARKGKLVKASSFIRLNFHKRSQVSLQQKEENYIATDRFLVRFTASLRDLITVLPYGPPA
jgi:hypothetical protein